MISRIARDNFARQLRLLVVGQISNYQFEDSLIEDRRDPALHRIYMDGAWFLYDDLKEHRLTGKWKLEKEQKRFVSRLLLFLKSDLPYEWVEPHWTTKIVLFLCGLLTLGVIPKYFYRSYWKKQGNMEIWPFYRQTDFESVLANPIYLNRKT